MSWAALLALAVCGILLSIALIDAETQTIPDRLNFALAVCGVQARRSPPPGGGGISSVQSASACDVFALPCH